MTTSITNDSLPLTFDVIADALSVLYGLQEIFGINSLRNLMHSSFFDFFASSTKFGKQAAVDVTLMGSHIVENVVEAKIISIKELFRTALSALPKPYLNKMLC